MTTSGDPMKFRAQRADLAAAVGDAARVISSRMPAPVLSTVRVTASAEEGEVEVVAYDFDVCIRATLPAIVEQAGVALIPGRVFADSLVGLPHGEVALEQRGARIEVRMPKVRYGLNTVAPEDYPSLPPTPPPIGTFDAGALNRAIAKAAVAARPVMGLGFSGVLHLSATAERLTIAATDRYTIAVVGVAWQAGGPAEPVTAEVNARALTDALKGMTGEVTVCLDDTGIGVVGAERTMISRRLKVDFPSWQAIVDRLPEPRTRIRVAADELAAAMGRAARVVAANHAPVRLAISPDEGLTYAAASDVHSELNGEVEVREVTGAAVAVGVNPVYLADAVKAAGATDVEIGVIDERKPLTITSPDQPGDVHIVMPVRLP